MQLEYRDLIDQMTLEEKASLLSGANFWNTKPIPRLGIPSMMLTDGPHGLRKQGGKADHLGLNKSIPATCFPTAATLANSWDEKLLENIGVLLGREAAAADVSVLCGPGLNLKRDPLCGRNFEYFSEDPFLSGKLAAAMVRGIQTQGVAACPKHYAVNSQETLRMSIDEVVDERALREIYLEGFRIAVQEGNAQAVMTSYNRVNGTYANENMHLMRDILYGEWGFDGVAVTDWGGENNRVQGLVAGNQLEMPASGGATDAEVVAAVKEGVLDEALVDESVNALLRLLYTTCPVLGRGKSFAYEQHHAVARDAAGRSIVLLKNDRDTLPLPPRAKVAIIGDFARYPRYQGAGSSLVNPTHLDNALQELQKENLEVLGFQPGFKRLGRQSTTLRRRAVALAQQADTVLLFLGLDESSEAECIDRPHMRLPQNQLDLLDALQGAAKRLVVVLSGGAPLEAPWAADVDAILHAYLGGQAGGGAVADVLVGRQNPAGKLAESYPNAYTDAPTAGIYPGQQQSAAHRESIFVGYRYYDSANIPVAWPFGYGLSYTRFDYRNLTIENDTVSFDIKNTGEVAGAEIAQLYITKKNSQIFRPRQELKGFARVLLKPGEEKTLHICLDAHAFSHYSVKSCKWVEEAGEYDIRVGASSRDIRLVQTVYRTGAPLPDEFSKKELPHYFAADVQAVPDSEFEQLLGASLPPANWDAKKPLGYTDTIAQGQHRKGFARFLYCLVLLARNICIFFSQPVAANNAMFAMNLPYRALARLTGGKVDVPMLDAILVMANGRFWKGLRQFLGAWRQKSKRARIKSDNTIE